MVQKLNLKIFPKLPFLVVGLEVMKNDHKYLRDVESWWIDMKKYAKEKTNYTSWNRFVNEENFALVFSDFLYSSHGAKYKTSFKFAGELECNKPAPPIIASKFKISYVTLTTPDEHIPARTAVNKVCMSIVKVMNDKKCSECVNI